jgi:hypothetical protein
MGATAFVGALIQSPNGAASPWRCAVDRRRAHPDACTQTPASRLRGRCQLSRRSSRCSGAKRDRRSSTRRRDCRDACSARYCRIRPVARPASPAARRARPATPGRADRPDRLGPDPQNAPCTREGPVGIRDIVDYSGSGSLPGATMCPLSLGAPGGDPCPGR